MQLYLIRHADAEPLGAGGTTTDAERPLTSKGLEQVAAMARLFQRLACMPACIVTSPLVRARQTADRLRDALDAAKCEVLETEELAPGGSSKKLARFLRKLKGGPLFLVGHEPDISRHAAWFAGSRRTQLVFAKAGVACLDCSEAPAKGAGTLLWLVTPSLYANC
jgi:phosphohistidine phosphatase